MTSVGRARRDAMAVLGPRALGPACADFLFENIVKPLVLGTSEPDRRRSPRAPSCSTARRRCSMASSRAEIGDRRHADGRGFCSRRRLESTPKWRTCRWSHTARSGAGTPALRAARVARDISASRLACSRETTETRFDARLSVSAFARAIVEANASGHLQRDGAAPWPVRARVYRCYQRAPPDRCAIDLRGSKTRSARANSRRGEALTRRRRTTAR